MILFNRPYHLKFLKAVFHKYYLVHPWILCSYVPAFKLKVISIENFLLKKNESYVQLIKNFEARFTFQYLVALLQYMNHLLSDFIIQINDVVLKYNQTQVSPAICPCLALWIYQLVYSE